MSTESKNQTELGKLLLLVVWPPVAALVVACALYQWKLKPALSARPPVAVINVEKAVSSGMDPAGSPASVHAAITKTKAEAKALRDHGYVVLNASYVYAYPSTYEANP